MRLMAFSVYDEAVKSFLPPVYSRSHGEMIRSFVDTVNSEGHQFGRHAEHYTLFFLGEFDDATGKFHNETAPSAVLTALKALSAK